MNIKFGDSSLNLKVDGSLANIDRGPRGYSAYEIAVQEGFVGTEEEWLASLVGPEGKQGKDGERGIQGPRGQQGDKGDRGDTGPQGEKGDRGDTGPQGDKGDIGPQGEKGDTGPSNVLSIGSVTKGDEANATITGESPNQILNLVLPKGDKGEKGEKGDTGPQGETGATGNGILSIQKTATAGLVDTYTTTFTDGTTTTFDVTNGEDGEVTQKQLDESQAKQDTKIDWLQTLVNQMPTVSGQGTDLSLESVLNYRLMKFLPQGVSSQDGEPTPTTPIPVKSVTGENSLVISTENLCGKKTINSNIGSTGNINLSANAQFLGIDAPIKINPSTTYTLKFINYENTSASLFVGEFDINGTFLRRNALSSARTFITSSDTYSIFFYLYSNASPFTTINTDIMLVKGSTAPTTYVEHEEQNYQLPLGNIELNSSPDGTIRDQIVGKPNEWYKREYIGKVVLDGSENWALQNSGTSNWFYYATIPNLSIIANSNINNCMCDHYPYGSVGASNTNTGFFIVKSTGTIRIRYGVEDTLDSFKSWLSSNNTTVYYVKAQYTDIPITDTTLINQLNNIYNNAHSYNGVTNITTTYEDGNEQMYLDIEALAKGGSSTTETDPIFSASASSGITSSDITNWNGKASTTYVDTAISNAITNTLGGSY